MLMNEPSRNASKLIAGVALAGIALWMLVLLIRPGSDDKTIHPEPHSPRLSLEESFAEEMYRGKNFLNSGEAAKAAEFFGRAVEIYPTSTDALLNLANAYLRADQPGEVSAPAEEALKLDSDSPAAFYLIGCALLRLGQFESAVKSLQQAYDRDQTIAAVAFQLGRAQQGLKQWESAAESFREALQADPKHPAAGYALSQVLMRLDQTKEAERALQIHQATIASQSETANDPSIFERCAYTEARVPFRLEQPSEQGIVVAFSDATQEAFSGMADQFIGPVGVLDVNHRGASDLFVREGDAFRLLMNTNGIFHRREFTWPAQPDGDYRQCLVADLQNDRHDDVLVIGMNASHAFRFATNGAAMDVTRFCGLQDLRGADGGLADLDWTGKLDVIVTSPDQTEIRMYRNLGNFFFQRVNVSTSGVPSPLRPMKQIVIDDLNEDDFTDLVLAQRDQSAVILMMQRGGGFVATNAPPSWPADSLVAVGDLNNDLRNDVVTVGREQMDVRFTGLTETQSISIPTGEPKGILLLDYDNDGWLDILTYGQGLQVWRNHGRAGFMAMTGAMGLESWASESIASVKAADFDLDCDTDLLLALEAGGLRLLRNEGGHANRQLKLRLVGNRSNSSGLGIRVAVTAGKWQTSRTLLTLPLEIGIGAREKVDVVTARWIDLAFDMVDITMDCRKVLDIDELTLPGGSCPYLYRWTGAGFEFVTDLLGASPLGLPISAGHYIEADPLELVWVGAESDFPAFNGEYVLQITEELREVLYLDHARLVVVDHPPDVEVHSTSKLRPDRPYPPADWMALHNPHLLLRATDLKGLEVTQSLRSVDQRMVSPPQLRIPQLRGLAEPHGVILDFGPLDRDLPLVLVLNGWLQFGGGIANIAASHHPELPFPFPSLEAELPDGSWQAIAVVFGAPAGKTKTILVDLTGLLPAGVRRLKISTAYEIHWDRIALLERRSNRGLIVTERLPDRTDLHWRGFSRFLDLPADRPLTPNYTQLESRPNWKITPMGWCTRYGEVDELVRESDNALVLLNGGDELTLGFRADRIPAKPEGYHRNFFIHLVGWDKDADFHVARGWTVDPLPYHGMNAQQYAGDPRPALPKDDWIRRFNTRWVGQLTFPRKQDLDGDRKIQLSR